MQRGFNRREVRQCATEHAEVHAIREACGTLQSWRLPPSATLYVTLEPCLMCLGACEQARIKRLVYSLPHNKLLGTRHASSPASPDADEHDPCFGALAERLDRKLAALSDASLSVEHDASLSHQSRALLQQFFASLRKPPPT